MKDNFKPICEAVCYWLGYQFSIGRERLIHEASLRYPIADAITSSELSIDKIQLEKGHPYFEDKVVDILVCNKNVSSIEVDSISSIFELKLSKQDTGNEFGKEHQRVVDDILRLAYFNLASKKDAFFLICGRYSDFKNYFIGDMEEQPKDTFKEIKINEQQGRPINSTQPVQTNQITWNIDNSLYKQYFHFEINLPEQPTKWKDYTFEKIDENIEDIEEIKKQSNFGLKSFQDRYTPKKDKTKTPHEELIKFDNKLKIRTSCVAITPFESITNRTHACGIWKIEAINEN